MATAPRKNTPETIVLENVGPIPYQEIRIRPAGITRLVAPNGSGKSLALEAVSTALRGSGKVPLRDQSKRGKVEVAGAKITIGGTCRHTGECLVEHLEGKLDIGELIDPRLKSESAADAARIKALIHLTGVKADPTLFQKHDAFEDWSKIVDPKSLETSDLVEMARRIKADYDGAARLAEAEAEREDGHADGMAVPQDLDLSAPHDSLQLAATYDAARDALNSVAERRRQFETARSKAEEARQRLQDLNDPEAPTVDFLQSELSGLRDEDHAAQEQLVALQKEIDQLHEKRGALLNRIEVVEEKIRTAGARQQTVETLTEAVKEFESMAPVASADVLDAEQKMNAAKTAMEQGAVIRQALQSAEKSSHHRQLASQAREKAARFRDAGRATDEVLSAAIQSDLLRIESDGKSARLVTNTARGKSTPYHELSAGERGAIAIDIASEHVGPHGILVISQEVFEGLDHENRMKIEAKAIEREVAILTAEASQTPDAEFEVLGVA